MFKTRIIKNRHSSGFAALDKWMEGSLWGNPISMGPDKYHVYGATRPHGKLKHRPWRTVNIEFSKDRIVVMRESRS